MGSAIQHSPEAVVISMGQQKDVIDRSILEAAAVGLGPLRFPAWGAAFVVAITVLAILVPATGRVAATMPSAAQQAAMAANSAAEAGAQETNLAAGVEMDESEPGLSAEEL